MHTTMTEKERLSDEHAFVVGFDGCTPAPSKPYPCCEHHSHDAIYFAPIGSSSDNRVWLRTPHR